VCTPVSAGIDRGAAHTGELDECVHEPGIEGLLLRQVRMVLITRVGLGATEAERWRGVRIVREETSRQTIDRGRARLRLEDRLVRRVHGIRVGREVVIERDILLKDDDQVLDRGGRRGRPRWREPRPRVPPPSRLPPSSHRCVANAGRTSSRYPPL
jgi:hypothetical protein